MKMWVMNFREDCDTHTRYEYYSNEDAANTRADYMKKRRDFSVWVNEVEILDKPREGAPEGYAVWDGVPVK